MHAMGEPLVWRPCDAHRGTQLTLDQAGASFVGQAVPKPTG